MVRAGLGVTLVSELALGAMPTTGVDLHRLTEPLQRRILVSHDAATAARPSVRAFVGSARRAARVAKLQPPPADRRPR